MCVCVCVCLVDFLFYFILFIYLFIYFFFLRSSPSAPVDIIYLPFDFVQDRPVRGAGRGFIAPGL